MTDNGTSKTNLLASLVNGDGWLKLATIALIVISGGTNFIETRSASELNTHEIARATQEIHALYPRLNEAVDRQKEILEILQRNH